MKRVLKLIAIVFSVVVVILVGVVAWLALRSPAMQPPAAGKIEPTPARVARGKYVVEHVADCLGCHSDHDATIYGFPVKGGTEGQGGFPFTKAFGVPGVVCAQNITSDEEFGLGKWTDGEVIRAFREGVTRDGRALFPMMPYEGFRHMSDEDAKSVVVYLRSLKPIHRPVPERKLDFPVNLLIKFAPQPVTSPVERPDPSKDSVAYGKYLVTIAGCGECHTNLVKGKRDQKMAFAGGWEMKGPWGTVVSANITPHPDTFIGRATREEFIGRFKSFESVRDNPVAVRPGENTVMPWLAFSGMTTEDLGAIYDYLRTLPPIANKVVTFPHAVRASVVR